jgi:hypothetical protein
MLCFLGFGLLGHFIPTCSLHYSLNCESVLEGMPLGDEMDKVRMNKDSRMLGRSIG